MAVYCADGDAQGGCHLCPAHPLGKCPQRIPPAGSQRLPYQGAAPAVGVIQPGDVILAVNRTEIDSVEQFRRLLAGRRAGSAIMLLVNRDGDEVYIRFALPE